LGNLSLHDIKLYRLDFVSSNFVFQNDDELYKILKTKCPL